jgi:hypothetical protein
VRKPKFSPEKETMSTLANRPNTALLVIDVQNGVVERANEREAHPAAARGCGPVTPLASEADLETLFAIQKESAVTGYANIFPPDPYPYPDADVRGQLRKRLGSSEVSISPRSVSISISASRSMVRSRTMTVGHARLAA